MIVERVSARHDKVGLDYAASFEADQTRTDSLRDIIARNYYEHTPSEWLASESGRTALNYEGVVRYINACRWSVPWVHKHCNLEGATVVDIGAGTGATTVAFSHLASRVNGYDINPQSVRAATERFQVMETANAQITMVPPDELLEAVKRDHPDGADFVLLFAVLEHMTQEERYASLRTIWHDILKPGGYFIVMDTPNRLAMFDTHTSHLPFFHLLPPEMAARYAYRSPRPEFSSGMQTATRVGADVSLNLHRWGIGASYHDFEIAFNRDLDGLIVANGFEWEIINWFNPNIDDRFMIQYFLDKPVPKDLGFARSVLNFIFQKPPMDGVGDRRPEIDETHLKAVSDFHRLDPRIIDVLARRGQLGSNSVP
jgi:2-polyprenyl-3-methyl-5-hydroxy-6-metoxy-1,4-benzoquinol methylase